MIIESCQKSNQFRLSLSLSKYTAHPKPRAVLYRAVRNGEAIACRAVTDALRVSKRGKHTIVVGLLLVRRLARVVSNLKEFRIQPNDKVCQRGAQDGRRA